MARRGTDLIQATATWAAIGRADGRPAPLGGAFQQVYGPSAGGRQVSARLQLPAPPATQPGRPWPLRATDLDTIGHVNNSVHWAAAEDALTGLDWRPAGAEADYNRPILPGCHPTVVTSQADGELSVWLLDAAARLASLRLTRAAGGGAGVAAGAAQAQ
jgi:acyl-ACP thioesterase